MVTTGRKRVGALIAFAFAASLALTASPARADLFGDTVDLSWHQPTPTTLEEDDGTQVVGAGVEYPSVLANLFYADIGHFTVTVGHTGPFLTIPDLTIPYYDVTLDDLTQTIVAASIDPANTLSGLTTADITVANGRVSVDLVGILWGTQQLLVLDLTVPEPSPLLVLLGALLALAALRRHFWRRPSPANIGT
jgi:hypothetical protein